MKILRDSRFWLIIILLIATAIRFYRLPEYVQFLGDEGRDVLIVKRMIVDHKFTLLGPTASVGGFYTGPIYYYLMLPFLWAFNLDPVGPVVMSALIGLATVFLLYKMGKDFFNVRVGLLAAFFAAISPQMINISRFSWNPNPIPFFILLAVYAIYLAKVRKRYLYTVFSGVCVGILYQLHYTNLATIPIIGLIALIFDFKQIPFLIIGFLLGDSLFLAFEIRHGFPNTKSMIEFIFRPGGSFANQTPNIWWMFFEPLRRTYETIFGFTGTNLVITVFASLAGFIFWLRNKFKTPQGIALAIWIVLGALTIGTYKSFLTDHYFSYLYPLPLLMVAVSIDLVLNKKWLKWLAVLIIAVLVYFEISAGYFWRSPNDIISQTKKIDKLALEMAGNQSFNFALITPGNSDHAYRYFLEIWGRAPVVMENMANDPERKTVTSQLLVVCEQKDCTPETSNLWEVWGFGKAKIVDFRFGPSGINVFKLVH